MSDGFVKMLDNIRTHTIFKPIKTQRDKGELFKLDFRCYNTTICIDIFLKLCVAAIIRVDLFLK